MIDNTVFAYVVIAVLVLIGIVFAVMRMVQERKRLHDLENEIDGENPKEPDNIEPVVVNIFNGIVTRTVRNDGEGPCYNYKVNIEKLPDFKTVDEVVEFANDFMKGHPPNIPMNLANYGPICRANQYIGERQILWYLFAKIWELSHPEDEKVEQTDGVSEQQKV